MRYPVLCGYADARLAWFRVFGYGLLWKDSRMRPLLFSERYGLRPLLKIGPFVLRPLAP